jgi:hypothetical protein
MTDASRLVVYLRSTSQPDPGRAYPAARFRAVPQPGGPGSHASNKESADAVQLDVVYVSVGLLQDTVTVSCADELADDRQLIRLSADLQLNSNAAAVEGQQASICSFGRRRRANRIKPQLVLHGRGIRHQGGQLGVEFPGDDRRPCGRKDLIWHRIDIAHNPPEIIEISVISIHRSNHPHVEPGDGTPNG